VTEPTVVRAAPVSVGILSSARPLRAALSQTGKWVLSLAVLYALWRWVAAPNVSSLFLSGPDAVLAKIWEWALDGTLWQMCWTTLQEALLGMAFGAIAGIALALIAALGPKEVAGVINPVFAALYAMPKFALIPLLLVWLGRDTPSRVIFVAITVVPIVFLNMITGLKTVDPAKVRMIRLFGGGSWQVAFKLLLPQTAGYLGTALTISAHNAIASAVGAEILYGATDGLGGMMYTSAFTFSTDAVIGALLVATVFSTIFIGIFQIFSRIGSSRTTG
jgi:ABC-type nitrate/sulfonate/bicarbonate transport system permease component